MKSLLLALLLAAPAAADLRRSIESHLGRPYVWGAAGLKSFDCSGFVWRVFAENGVLMKRTTARKLYVSLPRTNRPAFGDLVFFNSLKHVGIVSDPAAFYHAETSKGTSFSRFDPYWRPRVCGFRSMPAPPGSRPQDAR